MDRLAGIDRGFDIIGLYYANSPCQLHPPSGETPVKYWSIPLYIAQGGVVGVLLTGALVFVINMTIAVGTLDGILYGNIIPANAETYLIVSPILECRLLSPWADSAPPIIKKLFLAASDCVVYCQ